MNNQPRSSTETIIGALRVLANDIQSDDGIANACCYEASCRLEELQSELSELRKANEKLEQSETLLIEQRDNAQEYADALAEKISQASGYSIGEHSSANNPWKNALDIELPTAPQKRE